MPMLSSNEIVILAASIVELFACFGYVFLIIVISTARISALRTPFYTIFAITGVAAVLSLIVNITNRVFTQVFVFGPEFGIACNTLSYFSHVFTYTHTILKALQITNRFTALYFPLRHDHIWKPRFIWPFAFASYVIPAGIFSFFIIDQPALFVDIGGGRLAYAGIRKRDQQTAKILISAIFCLFVAVTLPMNAMLLARMRTLKKENTKHFDKEKAYLFYVVAVTASHMISGAHQIFFLVAAVTESSSLNFIARYTYAIPNTIVTFTPPIALILMSAQVRKCIQFFATPGRFESTSIVSRIDKSKKVLIQHYSLLIKIINQFSVLLVELLKKPTFKEGLVHVTHSNLSTEGIIIYSAATMLSPNEILILIASIAECSLCLGYLFLIIVISTTRISVLRSPFYTIFAVTGIAAVLNLVVSIINRVFNQVFVLGPEFGIACNFLSYLSHASTYTHSILKALQITNRFTALFFPLRHDRIWASRFFWPFVVASYVIPAAIFTFFIIDQPALYVDIGGGRLKYAGIRKSDQQIAKILGSAIFCLFVAVTLPMNALLLAKMRTLKKENASLFHKEKQYLFYVVAVTVSHMISGAHQLFWLVATITENSSMNLIAQYTYAIPNTIVTFTPPIALILMSAQVRKCIRFFAHPQQSESITIRSRIDNAANVSSHSKQNH